METLARDELTQLQLTRLQGVLHKVFNSQSIYGQKMRQLGVCPEDIKVMDDIAKLPFTTKQDMRDSYPYGLLAVETREIVRYHSSSGTTGKPTAVAYTKRDLEVWQEVLGRTLAMGGLNAASVFQVAVNYGMFTGGLGMHYAAESLGASVLPVSSGNTMKQIMMIRDFGTTAMVITPSYALYLAEAMTAEGVNPRETTLKTLFCGAEAWTDEMRRQIEDRFGCKAYDVYGLSEIIGPGVASDCMLQNGLHLQEDHFLPEIIDPVTGETLPDGQLGELVLTTLTKEGMPMVRYRTRDLTALNKASCPCGRTTARMRRVTGRTDDMLIIRGVNLFPSQVESVLMMTGLAAPHYQLIIDRQDNLDVLTVLFEANDSIASQEDLTVETAESKVQAQLASVLGIKTNVRIVPEHTLPRSEGKAKRVVDNRKVS